MHLHGTITPGPLSAACAATVNPGRECDVTRIFGNTDADTVTFDQTFLGGRTIAFGSKAPSCTGHTTGDCANVDAPKAGNPNWDNEDFFVVNGLQTTFDPTQPESIGGDVRAAHSLTLDGQGGTDTYVINTTGSQSCLGANQISGAFATTT